MTNCGECGKKFHLAKRFRIETRKDEKTGYWKSSIEVCEDCYRIFKTLNFRD